MRTKYFVSSLILCVFTIVSAHASSKSYFDLSDAIFAAGDLERWEPKTLPADLLPWYARKLERIQSGLLAAQQAASPELAADAACGGIADGLNSVKALAEWPPEPLQGDLLNMYWNMTSRVNAALLKAKVDLNPDMNKVRKEGIQRLIRHICDHID